MYVTDSEERLGSDFRPWRWVMLRETMIRSWLEYYFTGTHHLRLFSLNGFSTTEKLYGRVGLKRFWWSFSFLKFVVLNDQQTVLCKRGRNQLPRLCRGPRESQEHPYLDLRRVTLHSSFLHLSGDPSFPLLGRRRKSDRLPISSISSVKRGFLSSVRNSYLLIDGLPLHLKTEHGRRPIPQRTMSPCRTWRRLCTLVVLLGERNEKRPRGTRQGWESCREVLEFRTLLSHRKNIFIVPNDETLLFDFSSLIYVQYLVLFPFYDWGKDGNRDTHQVLQLLSMSGVTCLLTPWV